MYLGLDYFPFDASESIVLGIDFVNDLNENDVIDTASLSIAVAQDSQVPDPTPSARITGGPFVVSDQVVTFRLTSPIAGCKYIITITVTTETGVEIVSDYTHATCEMPL